MGYDPKLDFVGLLRRTANGVRWARMPGLDWVVAALARAGLFQLHVGAEPPTADYAGTVWLKPAIGGSWAAEGAVLLWDADASEYAIATPALWRALLFAGGDSGVPAPTYIDASQSPYAVRARDHVLLVDTSGGPVDVVMMRAAARNYADLAVYDNTGSANPNNITVYADAADTGGLDGDVSISIVAKFGGYRFIPGTLKYKVAT